MERKMYTEKTQDIVKLRNINLGSHFCWENMYLSVRTGTFNLSCDTGLKVLPTVRTLPRITRRKKKKKNINLQIPLNSMREWWW